MKAYLKNYRQSPRKVRLVADLIRGKSVSEARILLSTTPRRATHQLEKLLDSAIANAQHNDHMSEDVLVVEHISVDKGMTMRRYRPRAHGRASRIRKFTSNVLVRLGVIADKGSKATSAKKTSEKKASSEKKEADTKSVTKTAKKESAPSAKKSAPKASKKKVSSKANDK